jgi:hypothetical protein
MVAIRKHTWTRTELDDRGRPRRVTLTAYGYDFRADGRREREEDAPERAPDLRTCGRRSTGSTGSRWGRRPRPRRVGRGWAPKWARSARIRIECAVSAYAPVAQVDRAAVS